MLFLFLLFFFTLVKGPRRSLSLKLSDTRFYEPQIITVRQLPDHLALPEQNGAISSPTRAPQGREGLAAGDAGAGAVANGAHHRCTRRRG